MIVEALDPVNNVESCLGAGFVAELIDAFDLQRLEEAFDRRVDAPMSRSGYGVAQIREDQRVEFAYDIALQAPPNLFRRQALGGPSGHVSAGAGIASHPHHRDSPERVVGLSAASAIESVSLRLSGRRRKRARAAKSCQCRIVAQTFGVIPRDDHERGGGVWADAESTEQPVGSAPDKCLWLPRSECMISPGAGLRRQ